MALRVVFRPQAEDEALEVRQWYESRRAGLGQEFGGAMDVVVTRIAASPLAFPRSQRDPPGSVIALSLRNLFPSGGKCRRGAGDSRPATSFSLAKPVVAAVGSVVPT